MERFEQLTKQRWPDFEKLFEKHKGVRGGCWCSFYLATASEYSKLDREGRKQYHIDKLEKHLSTGGLLYVNDIPIAWCQFGKKDLISRFNRNRLIGDFEIDSDNLWRISCIFVDKDYRKLGYGRKVVEKSIELMISQGAQIIEAFPFDFKDRDSSFQHNGSVEFYQGLGFENIGRIGKNEVLMRNNVGGIR
jgi:GNAT superfamily N-acetyltransferase